MDLLDLVTATCEDLLEMQTADGNFPPQRVNPGQNVGKLKNHWCHGAPGAIGPLLAAVQLYLKLGVPATGSDEASDQQRIEMHLNLAKRLYQAAMKAAELTWQEGLLLKGNGMCHGISGNALLIHTVARWHYTQSQQTEELLGLD